MSVSTGVFAETSSASQMTETQLSEATTAETQNSVSTQSTTASESGQEDYIIEEITAFSSEVSNQTVTACSGNEPTLPETISVKLSGQETFTSLNVTRETNFKTELINAGTYTYTPVLPTGYQTANGVSLPTVTLTVSKASTSVSGLNRSITKKARATISDKITVSPAYGRTVKLQMKVSGKWVTKKTFTLKNTKSSTLTIKYTNDWWKVTSSSWRIVIPASNAGKSYTSKTITVKTKRYYQNPSKYVQIKDKITLKDSGGYTLKLGYMGLKVRKVNSYFGIGNKYWPRYTSTTKAKVKAFQKKHGLKATGNVNKATWLKMGFSESSWYNLGAYVTPIKVNPSSTKKQHIEAMISTAKSYLGSNYVVGASGTPSQGADCSGLVMQALYSAGVDPYPVSCVRHSKAGYEYESRNLWQNKKFKTVSYSKKKRGDLIFYKGSSGSVNHVAIYLGNGKVIESWPNKVVIASVKNSKHSRIAGVKRVFN